MPTQDEYNAAMERDYPGENEKFSGKFSGTNTHALDMIKAADEEIARLKELADKFRQSHVLSFERVGYLTGKGIERQDAHAKELTTLQDTTVKEVERLETIIKGHQYSYNLCSERTSHLNTMVNRLTVELSDARGRDGRKSRKRVVELNLEVTRLQIELAGAAGEIDIARSQRQDASNFSTTVQRGARDLTKKLSAAEAVIKQLRGALDSAYKFHATLHSRIKMKQEMYERSRLANKALNERVCNQREDIIRLQNSPPMMVYPDGRAVTVYHQYAPVICHGGCRGEDKETDGSAWAGPSA